MAIKYWTGNVSFDPSVAANWRGGVPVDGDEVIFSGRSAMRDCVGDLTAGGTVFLKSVHVDRKFYAERALGRFISGEYLKVAMKNFVIEACQRRDWGINDEPGNSQNFLIDFVEPDGSDENTSLRIFEQFEPCTEKGGDQSDYIARHRYIFKGFVKNVKAELVGHDPTVDGQGCSFCKEAFAGPSFIWKTDPADTLKTGFEVLKLNGRIVFENSGEPDSPPTDNIVKRAEIGPWGTNPANVTDITVKSWPCSTWFIDDLGNFTIDADNYNNVTSECYFFGADFQNQDTDYEYLCDRESVRRGVARAISTRGTVRASGSITFGALPADTETVTISDGTNSRVFVVETGTTFATGEADSSNNIYVNTNGMTTAAEVAREFANAINTVNVLDQDSVGAGGGTANLLLNIDARIDPANTAKVELLNYVGGTSGNAAITETFANAAIVVAGMTGGSTARDTSSPHSPVIKFSKLVIDSIGEKITQREAQLGFSETGVALIYSPSEIDRIEITGYNQYDLPGLPGTPGAVFFPVGGGSYSSRHTIHDGFIQGGYLDFSMLDNNEIVIDNGTSSTRSGGLQWRGTSYNNGFGRIMYPLNARVAVNNSDVDLSSAFDG